MAGRASITVPAGMMNIPSASLQDSSLYSETLFFKNNYSNRPLSSGLHLNPPFLFLWFPNWQLCAFAETEAPRHGSQARRARGPAAAPPGASTSFWIRQDAQVTRKRQGPAEALPQGPRPEPSGAQGCLPTRPSLASCVWGAEWRVSFASQEHRALHCAQCSSPGAPEATGSCPPRPAAQAQVTQPSRAISRIHSCPGLCLGQGRLVTWGAWR